MTVVSSPCVAARGRGTTAGMAANNFRPTGNRRLDDGSPTITHKLQVSFNNYQIQQILGIVPLRRMTAGKEGTDLGDLVVHIDVTSSSTACRTPNRTHATFFPKHPTLSLATNAGIRSWPSSPLLCSSRDLLAGSISANIDDDHIIVNRRKVYRTRIPPRLSRFGSVVCGIRLHGWPIRNGKALLYGPHRVGTGQHDLEIY